MLRKVVPKLAITMLFFIVNAANAAIVSGDFRTESNLPDYRNGIPLVYENLNASVGTDIELNDSHFVSNPDSWGGGVVYMDLDPITNILTLDSQDTWDFQTFLATINNIVFDAGEVITGLVFLGGDITDSGVIPQLSFTDTSVSIFYDYTPGVFNFSGETAQFLVQTSAVPIPAALWLFASGFAGLLGFKHRKVATKVS